MALVGGQLTEVLANANSGVVTCFSGATAGNGGGPLSAFKGAAHKAFTKLLILPNEIFVPNSYKFGGFTSHAKVRESMVLESI